MNPIAQAIHDIAGGRVKRIAHPGLWRVYAEDGLVYFENMAHSEPAVVICSTVLDVDE